MQRPRMVLWQPDEIRRDGVSLAPVILIHSFNKH